MGTLLSPFLLQWSRRSNRPCPARSIGTRSLRSTSSSRSWTAAGAAASSSSSARTRPRLGAAGRLRRVRRDARGGRGPGGSRGDILDVELIRQLGAYSDPSRDPRFHTISTVFLARATGRPAAPTTRSRRSSSIPRDRTRPLAFDHRRILDDYLASKKGFSPCLKMTTADRRRTMTPISSSSPRVYGPFGSGPDRKLSRKPRHRVHHPRPDGPSGIYPFTVDGLAEFKVLVQKSDLEKGPGPHRRDARSRRERRAGEAGLGRPCGRCRNRWCRAPFLTHS